jgi:type VI secretion system protein ImpB
MKAMKPRVQFTVPNTLTGEGNMAVEMTFESMDDFSPAAIAQKVEPLRKLLEARQQLPTCSSSWTARPAPSSWWSGSWAIRSC